MSSLFSSSGPLPTHERAEALRRTLLQAAAPLLRQAVHRPRIAPGIRFGRLVVLERVPEPGRYSRWAVRCDCGVRKSVLAHHLVQGLVFSCGCLRRQLVRLSNRERARLAETSVRDRHS